jgi:NDP-sugar pyrophosphorylase family protein
VGAKRLALEAVTSMRAMVLAAGRGNRLRPLTDSVPKPLLAVAGLPMVAFALTRIREAGIEEVVVNLHHLGGQIRAALGDGRAYGVRITYSEERELLDTGGGIAAARPYLNGDTFVVHNADTYIEIDLSDVIGFHRRCGALVTMVLRPDPDASRYGTIEIDSTGRVRRLLGYGPIPAEELLRALMYAGVMVFEPRVFAYMPAGIYSITRDVLPRLLDAGEPLCGYVHDGYWRVLDTPADLEAGRAEIAARLGSR